MIKDRRYHLKTYSKSFVGHDMVDWLLKKGEVESRREAVAMMQKLLENGVIHHGGSCREALGCGHVRACVRACVRVCACVCVRACVCV